MLFSQQAFGRLSSSGAVTVTVPLPGLATQALLSLKVDVISPCAQILPDGGAAPRRTVLGPHTGVTGACWLAPLTLPVTWVSVAYSTPGIHSKVPVPSVSPRHFSRPARGAVTFGQLCSCVVVMGFLTLIFKALPLGFKVL